MVSNIWSPNKFFEPRISLVLETFKTLNMSKEKSKDEYFYFYFLVRRFGGISQRGTGSSTNSFHLIKYLIRIRNKKWFYRRKIDSLRTLSWRSRNMFPSLFTNRWDSVWWKDFRSLLPFYLVLFPWPNQIITRTILDPQFLTSPTKTFYSTSTIRIRIIRVWSCQKTISETHLKNK